MDADGLIRFTLALVAVLGLIGVVAVVARRLGLVSVAGLNRGGNRVKVLEITAIDARRRLVLVRRDDAEHLLLLGATSEMVVETGIRAQPAIAPRSTP
jgi:flagellar protein FliO/FliZ